MKIILLAAGVGSRIAKDIHWQPKSILPIPYDTKSSEQIPLIVNTIITLQKYGATDISIVTGYLHESIEEAVIAYDVECLYNPFYYLMNSIGSLWFATHKINNKEHILILNADTFMEEDLIKTILTNPVDTNHPQLFIDSSKKDNADIKVTYNENLLQDYGKEIDAIPMAESLDVIIIPKELSYEFKYQLKHMLENKKHDTWWESALIEYIHRTPIKVYDIAGMFWNEIDFYEDYTNICEYLKNRKQ